MILAQSAATAASLALDGNGVVQDVPYAAAARAAAGRRPGPRLDRGRLAAMTRHRRSSALVERRGVRRDCGSPSAPRLLGVASDPSPRSSVRCAVVRSAGLRAGTTAGATHSPAAPDARPRRPARPAARRRLRRRRPEGVRGVPRPPGARRRAAGALEAAPPGHEALQPHARRPAAGERERSRDARPRALRRLLRGPRAGDAAARRTRGPRPRRGRFERRLLSPPGAAPVPIVANTQLPRPRRRRQARDRGLRHGPRPGPRSATPRGGPASCARSPRSRTPPTPPLADLDRDGLDGPADRRHRLLPARGPREGQRRVAAAHGATAPSRSTSSPRSCRA